MPPPRILLCGDVLGRLSQLFKRFSSVNKSAGPFDALFCVGQFFPDSPDQLDDFTSYVEGRLQVPVPTYFIGDYGVGALKVLSVAAKDSGNQGFKMDGLRICDNLYWLKGSGKFQLHGLNIMYLSGGQSSSGQPFGKYGQDDVDALRALAEEPGVVDMFLTNEWPSGVTNKASPSDIPPGISDSPGSDSTVAELVAEIKPRYHIAGSMGVFYAREPYSNINAVHVTRFIGLAPVGNKSKQKFLHAISPTPSSTMTATEICMKPPNTTLPPFAVDEENVAATEMMKRPLDGADEAQYWRYDVKKKRVGEGDGDKLCFKFLSSGSCPRGETCHFRHDMDAREQSLRGVCFDFLNKGKCERGPDCQFKHNIIEGGENVSNRRRRSGGASAKRVRQCTQLISPYLACAGTLLEAVGVKLMLNIHEQFCRELIATSSKCRSNECWFCLSSPNLESHLIISIGEYFYYALPKGGLVDDHVLIVPIEHSPCTLSLPLECENELCKFQGSLRKYCQKQGKEVVFFEYVSKQGIHANLQAVPVTSGKSSVLKNIFNLAAKKLCFEFKTIKGNNSIEGRNLLKSQFDGTCGVFYVELPDGTLLLHVIKEDPEFPAQFGRQVLAGLLKIPDKADWRDCELSREEEVELVETFKSLFKEFDPNV